MVHVKALGIKFLIIAIVIYSIFGIFGNANLMNLFWISLITTGVAYLIGDLVILPRFGNIIASIADFPLAFLAIWILSSIFMDAPIPILISTLFAALFIAFCEPFLHAYIQNNTNQVQRTNTTANTVQTEFAEETDAQDINHHKKKK